MTKQTIRVYQEGIPDAVFYAVSRKDKEGKIFLADWTSKIADALAQSDEISTDELKDLYYTLDYQRRTRLDKMNENYAIVSSDSTIIEFDETSGF